MKILGLIPARGGSKGVPGKNKKLLASKPLIVYTIEAALKSNLDAVLVSTDDQIIAEISSAAGALVPFIRPAHLAEDSTPTLPVIQHALQQLESDGKVYDAVCLLQPTNPFRSAEDINAAIAELKKKEADCLLSVLEVPHQFNPHWVLMDEKGNLKWAMGDALPIQRRQELPKAYYRDGSIYITKTHVINTGSLYGNVISYILSDPRKHVNIDTMADWEEAEKLMLSNTQ